ncbi:MAG: ATP-binding cassette domain-containing protein [Ignavibacteriae bacterium]|nr:ATP-binding cassette domain-containing protein [Ignavibacteriota bacterium]
MDNNKNTLPAPSSGIETVICLENLKKTLGGNEILKDVNLNIFKGETLIILGKSGSGKSVTLKCIVGLMMPDSGKVRVLRNNVPDLDYYELQELRRRVGFIFQSGALYDSMSVRENLEFPLVRHEQLPQDEVESRVREALSDVGLEDSIDKMPSELSGGMRKRIGLARTLILKPEIMLYDEPTTGLDPATSREISNLILKMQSKFKVTSVIVTHDMECARLTANRIVVLKKGVFTAEGSFSELQKSDDEFVRGFFE